MTHDDEILALEADIASAQGAALTAVRATGVDFCASVYALLEAAHSLAQTDSEKTFVRHAFEEVVYGQEHFEFKGGSQ